jgi:hypothetical protein
VTLREPAQNQHHPIGVVWLYVWSGRIICRSSSRNICQIARLLVSAFVQFSARYLSLYLPMDEATITLPDFPLEFPSGCELVSYKRHAPCSSLTKANAKFSPRAPLRALLLRLQRISWLGWRRAKCRVWASALLRVCEAMRRFLRRGRRLFGGRSTLHLPTVSLVAGERVGR